MENQTTIERLKQAHERTRALKERRKQVREELEAECQRDPSYERFVSDKKQAQGSIKLIKDEAAERTGAVAELNEIKEELALEQEILAACVETLIENGQLHSGQEFTAEGISFVPKLNVQLKLL